MSTYQIGNNVVVTFNMSANRDDLQSLDNLKHSKSFFFIKLQQMTHPMA